MDHNKPPIPLSSLLPALDLAAQATRSLSSASTDETLAALRSAHNLIGSFLTQLQPEPDKPPDDDDVPMQERGEEGEGSESRIIEEVEEGMRECVLQSKRRKRQVSPSWPAGQPADRGSLDPMVRRRSAIDLVFQFHA